MKKLLKITLVTTAALSLSTSLFASDMSKLDVSKICNVENNGMKNVLASAVKYNAIAKKEGVEFKRLGMTTTQYINGIKASQKSASKTVDVLNKKKKKTGTVSISYATWRACSFAVSALVQKEEAKSTWRLAVPGDGFKY